MPTMDLPLSDLDSASSIGDSDLLYAVVEGVSKSITKQVLLNAVTQVLTTKADLVQGILALSQMRENMKEVQNDTARFALTTNDVKKGFIIIVDEDSQGQPYSPNPKMYIVTDTAHLNTEAGYTPFASDVEWSTIENKPDNLVFSGTAVATETVSPIDPYLNASDVVNDLVTGGSDVPLSAEMGRTLNSSLTALEKRSYDVTQWVHFTYYTSDQLEGTYTPPTLPTGWSFRLKCANNIFPNNTIGMKLNGAFLSSTNNKLRARGSGFVSGDEIDILVTFQMYQTS